MNRPAAVVDSPALAVVTTLIRSWEVLDAAAVAACFAEDGVWHNMPYPPLQGRSVIEAAIGRFLDGVADLRFVVHHIAEIASGVVVTERNDVFTMKDGRRTDLPVMGIFEIADNRIAAWRDYFDAAVMVG